MSALKIALAQFHPALGHPEENRNKIVKLTEQAIQEDAKLIAFPELALTGYHTQEMTPAFALSPDDPFWKPLLQLSHHISILTGFVLESPEYLYFNSAAFLAGGELRHIHKKTYLPNYGVFEEGKWFAHGDRWQSFVFEGFRIGLLICEESWHLSPAYAYFLQGVDILFILANSSNHGKSLDDDAS